jgi:hypothetical protein
MTIRKSTVIRLATCSILVVAFCGLCSAQDFGNLPEKKHTVRIACLENEVPSFCTMLAKQMKKSFKVKEADDHGTYSLLIGGHRATDAGDPDPFYVVYGILTRTVIYKNDEQSDPEIANHFRRVHTVGTTTSDFRVEAQRFADVFIRGIQRDIAKIQR